MKKAKRRVRSGVKAGGSPRPYEETQHNQNSAQSKRRVRSGVKAGGSPRPYEEGQHNQTIASRR
jgi:hypothetical protein